MNQSFYKENRPLSLKKNLINKDLKEFINDNNESVGVFSKFNKILISKLDKEYLAPK